MRVQVYSLCRAPRASRVCVYTAVCLQLHGALTPPALRARHLPASLRVQHRPLGFKAPRRRQGGTSQADHSTRWFVMLLPRPLN